MVAEHGVLSIEDAELIEQCRQGDTSAFGLLIVKYQDRVFNTCLRICGNRTDAEDLTQETFVKAIQSIGGFGGRSQFYTWLFRIAVNLTLSARRKKARSATLSIDRGCPDGSGADCEAPVKRMASSDASPADVASGHEQGRIVMQALENLDDEAKTIIVLRDIESFNYEEIGEILDVPKGTVKSRLHRARMALREKLTPILGA